MSQNPPQTHWNLPAVAYGAVYFRKSNPPREDWERDYAQAARDGMNTFRHWFLWGATEIAPGEFDWDDYDRQMELGEKYGIGAIIAEVTHSAPEWAFRQMAHARYQRLMGQKSAARCEIAAQPAVFLGCASTTRTRCNSPKTGSLNW